MQRLDHGESRINQRRDVSLSAVDSTTHGGTTTLAGDFVIDMKRNSEEASETETTTWSLYYSRDVVDASQEYDAATTIWTDGTRAVKALDVLSTTNDRLSLNPHAVLTCDQHESDHLELFCMKGGVEIDEEIVLVLQLLQAQWVASHQSDTTNQKLDCAWRISIDGSSDIFYGSLASQKDLEHLFVEALNIDATTVSSMEWVEMMTRDGDVIGILPRPWVHKFNLLHRGIGVFVTKDRPIDLKVPIDDFPDVYVHQRVATKRIFPSLYDMFVGGVSGANEAAELTAQREVAEELGLSKALSSPLTQWSDGKPFLTCLVCTAYNRCLVDLYQYVMDSRTEKVSWQAEEVAWGSFVSYNTVTAAADLSIQRAAAEETWPGSYPPIQSKLKGSLPEVVQEREHKGWKEWDFVPDGLLVWNAWLEFLEASVTKKAPVEL